MSLAGDVMKHKAFRTKTKKSGRSYIIHLDFARWMDSGRCGHIENVYIVGHTWNEAFRKAALELVTRRLGGWT